MAEYGACILGFGCTHKLHTLIAGVKIKCFEGLLLGLVKVMVVAVTEFPTG